GRAGIGTTLVTAFNVAPRTGVSAAETVMGPGIDGFEGPNEPDNFGPPNWRTRLVPYLHALRASIEGSSRRPPLVGPSFVDSTYYSRIGTRDYDVASLHIYPGGQPPEQPLAAQIDQGRMVAPGHGVEVTETGYRNALAATTGQP